jgi:hypothetical protein
MSDLDFYADVLRAGAVLGLDAYCTPEQVTAVLGDDFGEYRTRHAAEHRPVPARALAGGLIRAAEQHGDRIRDPRLAVELAEWSALRPDLV